jgi:hypothetical protein
MSIAPTRITVVATDLSSEDSSASSSEEEDAYSLPWDSLLGHF